MNKYQNELDTYMNDIFNVAKKLNLKIWLEAGTLLGWKRNNDYIPWENDIDLGIWESSFKSQKYQKFKKSMLKKKYIVRKSKNLVTIRKVSFNTHADIAIYKRINNVAYMPLNIIPISKLGKFLNRLISLLSSKNIFKTLQFHKTLMIKFFYILVYFICKFLSFIRFKKIFLKFLKKYLKKNSEDVSWEIPLKYYNKFKKVKFRNFDVYIPYENTNYLRWRYGKDWKTPRSNWSQYTEDPTLVFLQNK